MEGADDEWKEEAHQQEADTHKSKASDTFIFSPVAHFFLVACRDSFRHTLAARARINQVNGHLAFAAKIRVPQSNQLFHLFFY
jgi:hypothetical protein